MREATAGLRPDRLTSPARLEPLGVVKQEVLGIVKSESPGPPPGPAMGPVEGGSVFGGLVSYFSSQHEDDMDA